MAINLYSEPTPTITGVELNGSHLQSLPLGTDHPTINKATNDHGATLPNGLNNLPQVEPIAVVGMGMRLPGNLRDSESFWKLLVEKGEARCRIPKDRYNTDAFYNKAKKPQGVWTDSGFFLQDVNLQDFDSGFFSMGKMELDRCDPQQRMLMEVVW